MKNHEEHDASLCVLCVIVVNFVLLRLEKKHKGH